MLAQPACPLLVEFVFQKTVKSMATHCAARIEILLVFWRPPVLHIAVRIELASFIVESVGHLMADNSSHGAIVVGVICLKIKEGGLQNPSKETISFNWGS